MENVRPQSTQSGASATKTTTSSQKLKDSCDLCSASKVKCDKQKPICGRCEKLRYSCFYSPARRGGRPYRPRMAPSQSIVTRIDPPSAEVSVERPNQSGIQSIGQGSESPPARESFSSAGLRQLEEPRVSDPSVSERQLDWAAVFDMGEEPMLASGMSNCKEKEVLQRVDADLPEPFGTSSRFAGLGPTELHPLSESSSLKEHDRIILHTPDSDCAIIAMNMLQDLDIIRARLSAMKDGQVDSQTVSSAFRIVTASSRLLSTILICPCSERTDIGLLGVAVCVTMLDVCNIVVVSNCLWENKGRDSPNTAQADVLELCARYVGAEDKEGGEIGAVRVLGELPKVARVILQFSKRYASEEEVEKCSVDFLPALVMTLRSRLQFIANEATKVIG